MKVGEAYQTSISVLMSVFNTNEQYLREAIESILKQSFGDYEFIIFNDCSDEKTTDILREYKDSRIRLVENDENRGLTKNLNTGIMMARGKYIARMDADDISLPNRFAVQYSYMERHPDIGILGGPIVSDGMKSAYWRYFHQEWRRVFFLFGNFGICHPTAFFRADFLKENNIFYNENYDKAQDYELWTRLLRIGNIAVCKETVLYYRQHDGQISGNGIAGARQNELSMQIRRNLFAELIPHASDKEYGQLVDMNAEILSARDLSLLFQRIINENKKRKVYSEYFLQNALAVKWFWILHGGIPRANPKEYRCGYWFRYIRSPQFWRYYLKHVILIILCGPKKIRRCGERRF